MAVIVGFFFFLHFSCWRQKMAPDILFLIVTTLLCSSNLIGESTAQELRKYRTFFMNKHTLPTDVLFFFKTANIRVVIRLKVQLLNSLSILKWSIPILQAFSEKKQNQNFFFQYKMQKIEITTSSFIWPIKNTWFLLAASHNWLHFRLITCIKSVNCPNPSYTRITDKK